MDHKVATELLVLHNVTGLRGVLERLWASGARDPEELRDLCGRLLRRAQLHELAHLADIPRYFAGRRMALRPLKIVEAACNIAGDARFAAARRGVVQTKKGPGAVERDLIYEPAAYEVEQRLAPDFRAWVVQFRRPAYAPRLYGLRP